MRRRIVVFATAVTLTAPCALAISATSASATPLRITAVHVLATQSCSQAYLPLPDPSCQPGVYNPDVTQDTIQSTICVSGYTKTIRPPSSYTTALKRQQIAEYGYSDTNLSDYEEDHLVALEDGGDPRAPQNLWPEPRYAVGGYTAANKDAVENRIHTAICNGTVTLDDARNAIATDWTTAEQVLGIG
jgi:hypothetical protein